MEDLKLKSLLNKEALITGTSAPTSNHPSIDLRSLLIQKSEPKSTQQAAGHHHSSEWMAPISHLAGQMVFELQNQTQRILQLDRSRRLAICSYLQQLAQIEEQPLNGVSLSPASPAQTKTQEDQELKKWTEGNLSAVRTQALKTYFEEVVFCCLGQTFLLKNWSKNEKIKLRESDLGQINWVLSNELRTLIPAAREPWNLTRNLFSWYIPSEAIQSQIWILLNQIENSLQLSTLETLYHSVCLSLRDLPENRGFDPRFIQALSQASDSYGFDHSTASTHFLERRRSVFTPTLRDGSLLKNFTSNSSSVDWIATEVHLVKLLAAELALLWQGPVEPPLWMSGSGLEVSSRDQMDWNLKSRKPSTQSRIAEIESCDLSYVFEERSNPAVHLAKEVYENLKSIRNKHTSLGEFQACVAIQKLRPRGLFWWVRNEPLSIEKNSATLKFLFDRTRLIAEWDLSQLEHQLPSRSSLYSQYIYLFERDASLQSRATHSPSKVMVKGTVRSHIEFQAILAEVLTSPLRESFQKAGVQATVIRPNLFQNDWLDQWPDHQLVDRLQLLDQMQTVSMPLGEIATIRAISLRGKATLSDSKGCLWAHYDGRWQTSPTPPEVEHAFQIWPEDPLWLGVLKEWIEHPCVQNWTEMKVEKKNQKPQITEAHLRLIPVPESFKKFLLSSQHTTGPLPLERIAFVRYSQEKWNLLSQNKGVLSSVKSDGSVDWSQLLALIPKSSWIPASTSPLLEIQGRLPPHQIIQRMDRVQSPKDGFILVGESGVHCWIGAAKPFLNQILGEQFSALKNPTWAELVSTLRLPRSVEHAEEAATQLLRHHSSLQTQILELDQKICSCKIF